jgi:hypothetical protein
LVLLLSDSKQLREACQIGVLHAIIVHYSFGNKDVSTNSMKRCFYITFIIGLFNGCTSSGSYSTKIDSDNFRNKADRIESLKAEIKSFSDFEDAEFELFNVNGFQNTSTWLPGASSWDYKFVIKVDTVNIIKWTDGMQAVNIPDYDDRWTKELVKNREQSWKTYSVPQYFVREGENVTMLVYKSEGIIFKRVTKL